MSEVVRLRRENPERVLFNAERGAVQVLDCDGGVVANFPASSDVMQFLHAQD
ncbi:hypothetical protein [Candidatus Palauibacter sp.]|uniref:hypothetical protein n=1 Tax=Candidatus Palauibacter sp. TaxID=3101350 RepID=UPI003AF20721